MTIEFDTEASADAVSMDELYTRHHTLSLPPRGWLHESQFNKRFSQVHANLNADQFESRKEIYTTISQQPVWDSSFQ